MDHFGHESSQLLSHAITMDEQFPRLCELCTHLHVPELARLRHEGHRRIHQLGGVRGSIQGGCVNLRGTDGDKGGHKIR